jgi:hypothetical protein
VTLGPSVQSLGSAWTGIAWQLWGLTVIGSSMMGAWETGRGGEAWNPPSEVYASGVTMEC